MKNLLNRMTASAAILGLIACFSVAPALAQGEQYTQPQVRTISVSGESSQQVMPNQAILSMSLVSKDQELNKAKQQNDAMVEKLVAITRQFNIPKDKISTSNIYIAPEYSYHNPEGRQPTLMGYVVNRSLRITMDTLDTHERLLSAIVEAKIDQVNGIDFQLDNPEKYAAALRIKAFEDAKAKAQALAQAAGGALGKAITISTTGNTTPIGGPPMPFMAKAMMAESAPSVAPSLPGVIELRQTVNVTFALE